MNTLVRLQAVSIANLCVTCFFLVLAILESLFGLKNDFIHENSMKASWLGLVIWPSAYFWVVKWLK